MFENILQSRIQADQRNRTYFEKDEADDSVTMTPRRLNVGTQLLVNLLFLSVCSNTIYLQCTTTVMK